ncbi:MULTISPECIES: DUF6463 family protein [Streptomyces]|uniref:DUF4386 family protein n=1 Tax=Streptomyces siderophoricus TaxID=2802281 RepID=A0ABS1MSK5_9ACTN|nr:DUF6463 family protein [Streptomyces sp. 9-7]MBL1090770.1 hypothetical protein [Streptomyces sp. 9-7]
MIKCAGWLFVLFGAAHTLLALTMEGAARHAGEWFSGALWGEGFSDMSPANSALWLSLESFGPPLVLLGLVVLWLDGRGITPPPFIAWTLGILSLVDAVILITTPWPLLLLANILLLVGGRRAARRVNPESHADAMRVP